MQKIQTWVVFNDVHIEYDNKKAVNCLLKAIDFIKPFGLIANGDIMNCGTFSRHDINKAPKSHWTDSEFLLDSEEEYRQMGGFLDRLQKVSPDSKKVYLLGNHEVWLQEFIKQSPQTRNKLFALENRLPIRPYKWTIYPYRYIFKLGKLRVTHGLYIGQNHAKKHVTALGKSILYGDTHDIESASKVTPESESFMAWSNGCLCDMNPDYLHNKPNNWNHGFAIVYVYPNGNFQVDIKRIQQGKVVVNGKLIEG